MPKISESPTREARPHSDIYFNHLHSTVNSTPHRMSRCKPSYYT